VFPLTEMTRNALSSFIVDVVCSLRATTAIRHITAAEMATLLNARFITLSIPLNAKFQH
jgi:hypothetical protein